MAQASICRKGLLVLLPATLAALSFTAARPVGPRSGRAYEGFGAATKGHLDCPGGKWTTVRVTNLNDGGKGSFRAAVLSGSCRHIVFDVGGTINIATDINMNQDYQTIDGSTAPPPGITLAMANADIRAMWIGNRGAGPDGVHDVIASNIRVVGPGGHGKTASDLFGMDGARNPISRMILDHVTLVGSNDGAGDIWGDVSDVTISWSWIRNTQTALAISGPKGRRQNISVHHNVFSGNNERQIKTNDRNEMVDYVNNVVYGWGWLVCCGSGLDIDARGGFRNTHPTMNVINNRFHFVPGLFGEPGDAIKRAGTGGNVYFSGNMIPAGEGDDFTTSAQHPIPSYARVTTYATSTLGNAVVPCVGTNHRTAAEQKELDTISRAVGGTGGVCSTE
jgi:hypothetical protein